MITRRVAPSESGKRLHRYLRNLMPNYPLGRIYKMIDQGKVRVNGKRKKQNYEVASGDELTIYIEDAVFEEAHQGAETKRPKFSGINAKIDVVYEDRELLVVNKPIGELTHPDRSEQKNTLINRVHAYLHKKGELDSTMFLPATANRLDRNTSGLVLIGKTSGMLHQLNQWIKQRELQKYYITIAEGTLAGSSSINSSLIREEKRNRTLIVKPGNEAANETETGGKSAHTRYRALAYGKGYTLVEVELLSGRTHQIRTHFQSIGHSLLGDIKYGGKKLYDVNHQLLHAWKLVLPDEREFYAKPPDVFQKMLNELGMEWP